MEVDTFTALDIRAEAEHLTPVRRGLLAWLRRAEVSEGRSHDITLAAYEALANSVEHAYGASDNAGDEDDGPSDVTVRTIGLRASRHPDSGLVVIRVWDQGVWDTTDGGWLRGRGLPLIYALADHVAIDSITGTTIEMRFEGT
ncbi:ATP-binding protein [Rhodococcoides trifolii]|nr:ATP-binding protein [Rhodococcus trifolii]